tara:strand:+ start:4275 stop:5117 length:843 start_codon:yes stop_codon:yes gene_type:complete
MIVYNIEDVDKILNEGGYKHISLTDKDNITIIPFNSNKIPVQKRALEIKKRLESFACGPGYYSLKCKNNITKTAHVDSYMIQKPKDENLAEEIAPGIVYEEKIVSPNVCSYEEALKMQVENEKLKIENAILQKNCEELETSLKQLEEDLNEQQLLSEEENPTKSWLNQVLEVGLPMLDKHFELKQKELELKAISIPGSNYTRPAIPDHKVVNPEKNEFETFVMTYQGKPEFDFLADIYNNANSPDDFMSTLKDNNKMLYENCLAYINPNYKPAKFENENN